jgi:hypothetical protein
MPSVFVVPVYVEVPAGFERAVDALEFHLRQAGYAFHVGEVLWKTLDDVRDSLPQSANDTGGIREGLSQRVLGQEGLPEAR